MRAIIALGVLLAGLTGGCTGTGHTLPVITEAETSAALQEISAAHSLKPVSRTTAENEQMAREVLGRLQTAASPSCQSCQQNSQGDDRSHHALPYLGENRPTQDSRSAFEYTLIKINYRSNPVAATPPRPVPSRSLLRCERRPSRGAPSLSR